MTRLHHHHKVRQPFYSIKEVAVGATECKRREGFRKREGGEADFGSRSATRRSLDGVNVASVFICGIWTDDVEETPFGRLFRREAWLVTIHPDAPSVVE
jgi:hypothetical protein